MNNMPVDATVWHIINKDEKLDFSKTNSKLSLSDEIIYWHGHQPIASPFTNEQGLD